MPSIKQFLNSMDSLRSCLSLNSIVLPKEANIVSGESSGTSLWTKIAKLSVILSGGKCIKGPGARALVEGEYHSAIRRCD